MEEERGMSFVDKGYLCSVVHVLYSIIAVGRKVFYESQCGKTWNVDISLEGHLVLLQQ